MSKENILIEIDQGIGKIILNNPENFNPLTSVESKLMFEALESFEKNENIRVILLKAKGKNFSAGGNIKKFEKLIEEGKSLDEQAIASFGTLVKKMRSVFKPIVIACNGVAAGAGAGLVLAADFVVMEEKGKLMFSFANVGLSGDTGALYSLNNILGPIKTSEVMMLGGVIKADECKALSLVTKVVTHDEFDDSVTSLINRLANGPSVVYARQKELISKINYGADFEEYLALEAEYMSKTSSTEDFGIAVKAFINKEQVKFIGK